MPYLSPRGRDRADVEAARVSDPMHRSNHRRVRVAVLERPSQLLDQAGEAGVGHERVRPQPLVQLTLADDAGSLGGQEMNEIEGLGREMDGVVSTQQLPAQHIDRKRAESQNHPVPHGSRRGQRIPGSSAGGNRDLR